MSSRLPRDPSPEFDDLANDSGSGMSPDVTDNVMARLGFVRVSPEEARRIRRRRWAFRASVLATLAVAAYGAFLIRDASIHARFEAEGPAISSALGQDMNRHASNLQGAVHLLRQTVVGHHDGPSIDDDSPSE